MSISETNQEINNIKDSLGWKQKHPVLWRMMLFVCCLFIIVLIFIVGLYFFLNTSSGMHFLERKIDSATKHQVQVSGLRGSFPNHLQADNIAFKDPAQQTWMDMKEVSLGWSALSLLKKEINIDDLDIKNMDIYSVPHANKTNVKNNQTENNAHDNEVQDQDHEKNQQQYYHADTVKKSNVRSFSVNVGHLQVDHLDVADQKINAAIQGKLKIKNIQPVIDLKNMQDLFITTPTIQIGTLNHEPDFQFEGNMKRKHGGLLAALLEMPIYFAVDFPKTSTQDTLKVYMGLGKAF